MIITPSELIAAMRRSRLVEINLALVLKFQGAEAAVARSANDGVGRGKLQDFKVLPHLLWIPGSTSTSRQTNSEQPDRPTATGAGAVRLV
jgi:hypothetical protein